jgi:hypothetical protein
VFIFPTTEWRASSHLTKMQRLLTSPENWIQRSRRCLQHSANIRPGREGLFNLVKTLPPTLKYEPRTIVADGDLVIVHGRFSGFQPVSWHRLRPRTVGRPVVLQQSDPAASGGGYEVMASQHSLDSVKGDVATVKRTLGPSGVTSRNGKNRTLRPFQGSFD